MYSFVRRVFEIIFQSWSNQQTFTDSIGATSKAHFFTHYTLYLGQQSNRVNIAGVGQIIRVRIPLGNHRITAIFWTPSSHNKNCNQKLRSSFSATFPSWLSLGISGPFVHGHICSKMIVHLKQMQRQKDTADCCCSSGWKRTIGMKTDFPALE